MASVARGGGGGGGGPLSSITLLSLKLDYSNFVQNYFGINEYFETKRIRIKLTMKKI